MKWRVARRTLLCVACIISGCRGPAVLSPPPLFRATSVNAQAVEVEFAEALDRVDAQDRSHYVLHPAGNPAAAISINRATLVDTIYGRAVLLVASEPLPDSTSFTIESRDVRALSGKRTGRRTASFSTGLNYDPTLRELFAQHCNSCHGSARVDGNYRTDSYTALFGNGTDNTPDLIAGNPNCRIVVKTKPGNSMFVAGQLSYLDSEMIRNWVVNYQARR